jgi:pyrroline-5-carboxylate reductase
MSPTAGRILIIGCGNMGVAMLRGLLANKSVTDVHVVEPNAALLDRAIGLGARGSLSIEAMPGDFAPALILMAVKPALMMQVLEKLRVFNVPGTTFLSVAAGVTLGQMEAALGAGAAVVRCMPNTPAAIGEGALVCCANHNTTQKTIEAVRSYLSDAGKVFFLEKEELIDSVTAISGSGPAYLFYFIECLTEAGKALGLPEGLAGELALQTVVGASLLARTSGQTPKDLREAVTSPYGTTAAALSVLMAPTGLDAMVRQAATAAKARSIELANIDGH